MTNLKSFQSLFSHQWHKQLQASEKPIEDEEPQTLNLSLHWSAVLIAFPYPKLIVPFNLAINATQVDKHHTWMSPNTENGRSCSSQMYFGPFEVHHSGHKKYRNEFNLMPFYSNGSARSKKVGRWLFDMFRMREQGKRSGISEGFFDFSNLSTNCLLALDISSWIKKKRRESEKRLYSSVWQWRGENYFELVLFVPSSCSHDAAMMKVVPARTEEKGKQRNCVSSIFHFFLV